MDRSVRWQRAVADLHAAGRSFVLVTLVETRGSSPRDDDGKMVVTKEALYDTIGGGELEHRAVDMARELLAEPGARKRLEDFPLGPKLGQCCGGYVRVLLERIEACRMRVELHGAGHVAKALVKVLGDIDCLVRWIDERDDMFPDKVPDNVTVVRTRASAGEVAEAPAGAWHLVMTHDHALDLEICDAVLSRGDFDYLGLIGSRSKAARFGKRLAERGFTAEELDRLHCPIGLPYTGGKAPMEIAVSVAADLMRRRDRLHGAAHPPAALELVRR